MNCLKAPAASRCASLAAEQVPLSRQACLQAVNSPDSCVSHYEQTCLLCMSGLA